MEDVLRIGKPIDVNVDDVLTSERLELLASRADLAAAPALAASWQLSQAEVRAVQSLYQDAVARNTDRSYTTARRYWHAWYQLRYQADDLPLPMPPQAVLRFIVDHVLHWDETPAGPVAKYLLPEWIENQLVAHGLKRRGAWAVNTIEHRVSVLSSMHDATRDAAGEALPNPCRDPYVVRLLRAVRKAHAAHHQVEKRRDAATRDVLQELVSQCDPSTLRGLRDMAVLLVGFNSGGRRRSEIAALTWERLVADGQNYLWKIGQTKTSDGKDVDVQKPIQGVAAQALRAWREASGVTTGLVFREITRQGKLTDQPMSGQAIYRMVQRLAKQAGQTGDWGAHSLRAGFMTQAGRDGQPLAEAMALSDHSSVLVANRYYRTGAASTSPAANLAEGIELPKASARPAAAKTKARKPARPPAPRAVPSPPAAVDGCQVARIRLHLVLVENHKYVRTRGEALRAVEDCLIGDYSAHKTGRLNEYELEISYRNDGDFDRQVRDVQIDIGEAAELYDCFTDDTHVEEIGRERDW